MNFMMSKVFVNIKTLTRSLHRVSVLTKLFLLSIFYLHKKGDQVVFTIWLRFNMVNKLFELRRCAWMSWKL